MKPSMIVYGVPNGKTRFAERIAKFYGLRNGGIFSLQSACSRGYIYFDSVEFPSGMGVLVKSFREVADEINAAIPLTDWFERGIRPTKNGWYERDWDSTFSNNDYFDGKNWFNGGADNVKSDFPSIMPKRWRGLSQEPIVID